MGPHHDWFRWVYEAWGKYTTNAWRDRMTCQSSMMRCCHGGRQAPESWLNPCKKTSYKIPGFISVLSTVFVCPRKHLRKYVCFKGSLHYSWASIGRGIVINNCIWYHCLKKLMELKLNPLWNPSAFWTICTLGALLVACQSSWDGAIIQAWVSDGETYCQIFRI